MKKLFWLVFWLISLVAFSQEKATFSIQNKTLSETLFSLENIFNVRFSYPNHLIRNKQITLLKKTRTIKETLFEIEDISNIFFEKISNRYYILKPKKEDSKNIELLEQVVVNNYLTKGISKNKKGYFTMQPYKLDILPGLIETDVLESIQQLPGVVSPNETATGLVIRGGTSDQNRIIWDGINIYHNGHLFGMISAFNPNIAKTIIFHNKGTNPKFGERISSVIDIKTNNKINTKTKASLSFNGINLDAVLEIPIIKNKLSIQASVRRSYADVIQTPTFNKLAQKVFQNTKITNLNNSSNNFSFIDYNTKINYQLNKKNKISFSGIYIANQLDYLTQSKNTSNYFNDILNIKNEGYAVDWNIKWSKNIQQNTNLNFSKYYLSYNFIEKNNSELISNFNKQNVLFDTSFNTDLSITKNNNNINIGYQYNFKDVNYAFIHTKSTQIVLDNNKSRIGTHSLFTNYSYKHTSILNFDIGFRINHYKQLKKTKFEPRIIIYKSINNYLKLQVTGEIKNQIISQIDETILSDLSLENKLWHLANEKSFPIINSNQISTGLIYNNKGWSFDLDLYRKNSNGITALSLGFLNPDGKTFRIGNKKINGLDFYTKKDWNKLKTWISYSYTDVRSKFKNLNKNNYFISNTSINHAVSTSISYKIKKFQIALGWKWRTGKPFTKSIVKNNKIEFEGINTERLPNYHRLDFSSTYQFNFSKKNRLKAKIGFSIKNIYNQKNHLSKEYSGFNNLDDPITVQDRYSLGFMPNFLFKVYF